MSWHIFLVQFELENFRKFWGKLTAKTNEKFSFIDDSVEPDAALHALINKWFAQFDPGPSEEHLV